MAEPQASNLASSNILPDSTGVSVTYFSSPNSQGNPEYTQSNYKMPAIREKDVAPQPRIAMESGMTDTNGTPNGYYGTGFDSTHPVGMASSKTGIYLSPGEITGMAAVAPINEHPATNEPDGNGSEQRIRRPPNAFFLFAKENRKKVASLTPNMRNAEVSTRLGEIWARLPVAAKQAYMDQAKILEQEHKMKYPAYTYRPAPKGQGIKGRKRKEKEGKGGGKATKTTKFPKPCVVPDSSSRRFQTTPTPNATIYPNMANMALHQPMGTAPVNAAHMNNVATPYGAPIGHHPQAMYMTPQPQMMHQQQPPQNLKVIANPGQGQIRAPEQSYVGNTESSMAVHYQHPIAAPGYPPFAHFPPANYPTACPNCAFPLTTNVYHQPLPAPVPLQTTPMNTSQSATNSTSANQLQNEAPIRVITPESDNAASSISEQPDLNDMGSSSSASEFEAVKKVAKTGAKKRAVKKKPVVGKRGRGRPPKKAIAKKIKMSFTAKKKSKKQAKQEEKDGITDPPPRSQPSTLTNKTLEDGNMSQGSVGQMVNSLTRSVQESLLPEDARDLPSYTQTLTNDDGEITTVESQRRAGGFETVIRHFKRSPSQTDLIPGGGGCVEDDGTTSPMTATPDTQLQSEYSADPGTTPMMQIDEGGDGYTHSSCTEQYRSTSEPSSQEPPPEVSHILLQHNQIQRSPLNYSMPAKDNNKTSSNDTYSSQSRTQPSGQQAYSVPMNGMYMPLVHAPPMGPSGYVYPAPPHGQQYQQTDASGGPMQRLPVLQSIIPQPPQSMASQYVMHWPTQ